MNDIPREKLREIIKRYGLSLLDNPRRVRALLLDLCSQYKREIFVLVQAQEEAVAEDLLEIPDSIPLAMLLSQLTNRLVENRALSPEAARWGVESWAYALGKPVLFTSNVTPSLKTDAVRVGDRTEALSPTRMQSKNSSRAKSASKISQFMQVESQWAVDFYWQDKGLSENTWDFLGQTPGKVLLPTRGAYKLHPHISGDDLRIWASEIDYADRVVHLTLDKPVTDLGFSALQSFPNVIDLAVNNAESLSNDGFSNLQYLETLEKLQVTWCTNVKDEGFSELNSLKHLQEIRLEWTSITDKGCQSFSNIPALSHLGLRECKQIHGQGLQFIQKNTRITSLDLAGASNLDDGGMEYVSRMEQMTKLNLSHCSRLSERGLVNIQRLQDLAHLDVGWVPALTDSSINVIAGLSHLTSLGLSHTKLTNTGLSKIKSMRNLAYLDLSGCDFITDRGLKNIGQLPNLTHLNLSGCKRLSSRGIDRLEKQGLTILR